MKMYGTMEVKLHAFLTSAVDGSERSTSKLGRFTFMEIASSALSIGGWVGSRAG
jgi:hypothetical protein